MATENIIATTVALLSSRYAFDKDHALKFLQEEINKVTDVSSCTDLDIILKYMPVTPETHKIVEKLKSSRGIIFHNGKPGGLHECSNCLVHKDSSNFNYYNKRVDKNDYLMRSNALCSDCSDKTTKERKHTLTKAQNNNEIGAKPLPGDTCPNCNRKWGTVEQPRNWHRDHDAIEGVFRGWLCGDCNMAKHDHRHRIS